MNITNEKRKKVLFELIDNLKINKKIKDWIKEDINLLEEAARNENKPR